MPSYNVYVYETCYTQYNYIDAESIEEAIEAAQSGDGYETIVREPAEEVTGFLVDELDQDGYVISSKWFKAAHQTPWEDNAIQFPRLLSEIAGAVTISEDDWLLLCESMDLSQDEVRELFNRAQAEWENIKNELTYPSP